MRRLHQPCLPPVDNGSSAKASIFTGRGFPPKTSSGYGGSALMLPGSAACNSCSPGNKAFNINGHHNGSNGGNGFAAGCGPRNCASRNGGSGPAGMIIIILLLLIKRQHIRRSNMASHYKGAVQRSLLILCETVI